MKSFGKLVLVIGLIAIGSIILAINSDAAETTLVMDSDSGDYIGGGLLYFYTTADGAFTAQHNSGNSVSISFNTPGYSHFWNLDFAAPNNGPLAVGTYSGAMRFPFQNPGLPGLSVYGDGNGCNTSIGSFEIKQVTYGTTNDIVAFWATFEQHCEGAAPALRGEIRFNANAPNTTTVISSSFNPSIIGQPVTFTAKVFNAAGTPTGNVSFMDESVALGTGLLAGSPATATFTTSSLSIGTNGVTAVYGGSDNFSSSISAVMNQTVEQTNATVLIMNSDPGDYIGGGLLYFYTIADGTFTARHNFDNGVSISFSNNSHSWNLDFAAPNNGPLAVGTYSGAMRFPFQNANAPGLDVSGDGRGCNTLVGSFEIKQVTYGTTNDIVAFSATFEQHCEGAAPALRGEIRFNANVDVLTITKTGTGTGDVTADSETINWSGNSGDATYDSNTSVTLTASASNDSTFTSWSGCDATNGNQCTLTMNTDRSVTAIFTLVRYTLAITKSGTGNGRITSSPFGIDCGSVCSSAYNQGTVVTLTAMPDNGSIFTGWNGGSCVTTGTCITTLNGDTSIIATFSVQTGTPNISVSPKSVNFGSVGIGNTSIPKTITIKNKGKGYTAINSITITGTDVSEFDETNNCSLLSPGGSCAISVNFAPISFTGKKSAIISISSNDPKRPTILVKLSGQSMPNNTIEGTWYVTGDMTIKVSIKGHKSQTQKTSFTDEFIFDGDGDFSMTDLDGTWSQKGSSFIVTLDPENVANYFTGDLSDEIGSDVSVEVTQMSFIGKKQKNGTIKGTIKLKLIFYIEGYDLSGNVTVSNSYTGTQISTQSISSMKEKKASPMYGSILNIIQQELDNIGRAYDKTP